MSEISKYEAYKKKLQGVCDENDLVFRFRCDRYPITLTIKPVTGLEEQLSLLENVEDKGYTSPDASIVFFFKDGSITYKTSQTFTINAVSYTHLDVYKRQVQRALRRRGGSECGGTGDLRSSNGRRAEDRRRHHRCGQRQRCHVENQGRQARPDL